MVLQGVDTAPPAGSPSRFTRMIVHRISMTRGRHFYFHVAHCNRPITDLEIKTHYTLWLQTCGDAYSMIVWLYTPTYILRLEFLNKTYSPFHIDQRIPEFSDSVPWRWRKALKIMPHTGTQENSGCVHTRQRHRVVPSLFGAHHFFFRS